MPGTARVPALPESGAWALPEDQLRRPVNRDSSNSAAELVRLMATLHNPPCGWTPYHAADGRRYYDDSRGRTIALLTAAGEVVPGPWFKQ
jgi:hypothetical protein